MKKILVIEDSPDVRENLAEILELSGYNVVSAPDGTEGVKMAMEELPDLILCDIMMPKLDGFGVLNILSKKPETASIPFVYLTAKAEKTDLRHGMNLGADDYLTKPFYKDELLNVIEMRLKKSEKLKQEGNNPQENLKILLDEARGFSELKKLSLENRSKVFKKKSVLFEEGEVPRYLYFLKSGKVKNYLINSEGKELITSICKSGEFIGHVALITGNLYTNSASTLEDSEITLIPKEEFHTLLFGNKDVSAKLIKILAQDVIEKEEHLLHLAYNSVRKRVADAIVFLSEKEGKEEINILRDDLAHLVGTAKESVIRMLSEFRDDKYIDIINGTIYIREKEKLANMYA